MSSMLEQAILDAKELKEAAIKNAQQSIIEKYSNEFEGEIEKLLEQAAPADPAAARGLFRHGVAGAHRRNRRRGATQRHQQRTSDVVVDDRADAARRHGRMAAPREGRGIGSREATSSAS